MTQIVINSLIAGSIYALVAMSFNLIYGVSRSFNLAHGAIGAVAAYVVLFLAIQNGVSLFAAIPAALSVAALFSWLLELSVFRPLRDRKASNLVLLIASLGIMVAVEALLAILFSSQFKTIVHLLPSDRALPVLDGSITGLQIVTIFSAFLVALMFWILLSYTRFGRAVRAIADDEEVARIVGIDTRRIIGIVFLLGGAVMGLAGVLSGFDTGVEPRMGFLLILGGAIASIVGGIGNVYGALLGAFLIAFAENFGVWFVSGQYKYAIAFSVLIVFLLFRPQGIFGKK